MRVIILLFIVLIFLPKPILAQQQNVFTIDSLKKTNPKIKKSESLNFLIQQIEEGTYERFFSYSRDYIFKSKMYGNLIVSSSNSIMFGNEIEQGKLFFTIFYFNSLQNIKEIKYFFFDSFATLRIEFLLGRNQLIQRIGAPKFAESINEKLTTEWLLENHELELLFKQENISGEGAIILSIKKIQPIKSEPIALLITHKDALSEVDVIKEVIKATSLRIKGADGTKVVKRLKRGNKVKVLGESNYFYTKVVCEKEVGWVKKSLLKEIKSSSDLVKKLPIKNDEDIDSLKNNMVKVTEVNTQSLSPLPSETELSNQLTSSAKNKYTSFISNVELDKKKTPVDINPPSATTNSTLDKMIIKKITSLRREGKDGAKIIVRLKVGETILVLSESNYYWSKVKYKDKEGWVKKSTLSTFDRN